MTYNYFVQIQDRRIRPMILNSQHPSFYSFPPDIFKISPTDLKSLKKNTDFAYANSRSTRFMLFRVV
jgi:hypothetical protein